MGTEPPENCQDDFNFNYVSDQEIEVYHVDKGWSAGWNYVCLNDYCLPGNKSNGAFRKTFNAVLGQDYKLTFKVEDRYGQGQQILDRNITFTTQVCNLEHHHHHH
uniref:beta-1,3-xylanase n=1 Tax=Alcaligenes sp. XY-234 TaxID=118970 RepID=UPI00005B2EF8|nr:Chain D, beta-1,3-xylanase [Alcaligenes sp. XY-234]2COV_E Chain E, beta-1,3-xylanase [Alcaligenes sp. XY-234]2COV_F Chain F, beta-1,3-xylanase [Alcaligenes sp. XY-234]2COV_G Chain G, beta-1,3-xylanase [Alcaligenes sp. XY-234]2COV_H Chain H, beta-1,3-xylanase [Alcaligenes sp. XY-234]2COV_I Chain I, beta-1,3-xylanase [Alcaligenes sp. XY-234]